MKTTNDRVSRAVALPTEAARDLSDVVRDLKGDAAQDCDDSFRDIIAARDRVWARFGSIRGYESLTCPCCGEPWYQYSPIRKEELALSGLVGCIGNVDILGKEKEDA